MKNSLYKFGLLVLVGSIAAGSVFAATSEVSSVNVVGYMKISVPSNQFIMYGMPFDLVGVTNVKFSVREVMGTNDILNNTKVYFWNGTNYSIESYIAASRIWTPNSYSNVMRGDAFWVKSPKATNLTILGQVPVINTPQVMDLGFQLVTYPYPTDTAWTNTVLGTNANNNDKIMVFNGTGYVTYSYIKALKIWSPTNPVFRAGDGFWYKAAKATNFTENMPYSL